MTIGFEPANLDAAVTAVIAEAARIGQATYLDVPARRVDLTDRAQVRDYLIRRVLAAYEKAAAHPDGVQVARIEGVPYRGIGFVFEHFGDMEMHPEPIAAEDGARITHLAYFWANLSP